jgi:hypothetical protein
VKMFHIRDGRGDRSAALPNADRHTGSRCMCSERVVFVTNKWVCAIWRDFRGETFHHGNMCVYVCALFGRQTAGGLVVKLRRDGR